MGCSADSSLQCICGQLTIKIRHLFYSKHTSNDVAALRGEVTSFIALMKQNMGLQPEASTLNEEQASGSK